MSQGLDFDQIPALFPVGPFPGLSQVCVSALREAGWFAVGWG